MTHRRAFTLIELLVVIAIIALLVSLLMPSLKQAKDLSKHAICQANTKQIGTAMQMYVPDNSDWMPGYANSGGDDPNGWEAPDGVTYHRWYQAVLMTCWHVGGRYPDPPRNGDGILGPYMSSSKKSLDGILSCPSMGKGGRSMILTHNSQSYEGWVWGEKGFGMNFSGVCTWDSPSGSYVPIRVEKIDVPDHLMFMAEVIGWGQHVYPGRYDNTDGNTASTPTPRHFGNFDLVFCDGHVDSGPLETFYQFEYVDNPNTKPKG